MTIILRSSSPTPVLRGTVFILGERGLAADSSNSMAGNTPLQYINTLPSLNYHKHKQIYLSILLTFITINANLSFPSFPHPMTTPVSVPLPRPSRCHKPLRRLGGGVSQGGVNSDNTVSIEAECSPREVT